MSRTSPDVDASTPTLAIQEQRRLRAPGGLALMIRGDAFERVQCSPGWLIDNTGPFPPAKLDMAPVVRNYADDRRGPHSWMLGRFIVPFARLTNSSVKRFRVDWYAVDDRYINLADYATTREDVNYIHGKIIGELNSSHPYR